MVLESVSRTSVRVIEQSSPRGAATRVEVNATAYLLEPAAAVGIGSQALTLREVAEGRR